MAVTRKAFLVPLLPVFFFALIGRPGSALTRVPARPEFNFPDGTPAKLILRGTLTCGPPQGECKFLVSRPADVTPPE